VILTALAAFLQAVAVSGVPAPTVHSLTVRVLGSRDVHHIPLVARADGQIGVRASLLADALGGSFHSLRNGHFLLNIPGASLELADQSSFATSTAGVEPLPVPPWVDGSTLYLPLAIVSDVLPRIASGVLYDPDKAELRVFTPLLPLGPGRVAARHVVAPDREAPPPSTGPPPPADNADADTIGVTPSGDVLLGERDRTSVNTPAPVGATHASPLLTSPSPPSASPSAAAPSPEPTHRRLVVVDAGHGGPDHGMVGPVGSAHPIYEKDITLAVALKVGDALRHRGIDVFETRTTDTLIALTDRGRLANDHHGDLFLSIHVNAANPNWHDPAAARGFETYFLAEAKTEDDRRVEEMENSAVRFETGANAQSDDPLDFVINDMAQNEHLRESADLAEIIQRHLAQVAPGPDRGVKQAGFRVLVTAYMPAVLVEIGFGTNPDEARYLSSPASQRTIANAIAAATAEYLARYERRVGPVAQ
jgi:N-acetylmuramoyl-L-alanine amidase